MNVWTIFFEIEIGGEVAALLKIAHKYNTISHFAKLDPKVR